MSFLLTKVPRYNKNTTNFKMIYSGSRDGWMHKDFHSRCDKMGATLTVVKSSKGRICGGYTQVPWVSARSWMLKADADAFVFSLDRLEAYGVTDSKNAIQHCVKHGPMFGNAL